jgi:hypothetical protein
MSPVSSLVVLPEFSVGGGGGGVGVGGVGGFVTGHDRPQTSVPASRVKLLPSPPPPHADRATDEKSKNVTDARRMAVTHMIRIRPKMAG